MSDCLRELANALTIAPVMGRYHPLVPLCLQKNVQIISDPLSVLEALDGLEPHAEQPILINQFVAQYQHRFLVQDCLTIPPAEMMNQALPRRIPEARQWLLTHHQVANRIVRDVQERHYQTVILLLVDGLSYADVQHWPATVEPCFIDGPSITFSRTPTGQIDPQVGFPAIVGQPPLARQLMGVGLSRSRGYSYWERGQNEVSAHLFAGLPLEKVTGLQQAIEQMFDMNLKGMYIQLLREGLDGLAHSRREVSQPEIEAVVTSIQTDLQQLVTILRQQNHRGAVYLVADHGLLWKQQHDWAPLSETAEVGLRQHPRYLTSPQSLPHTSQFVTQLQTFQLCHYGYFDRQIRANDSGVHGGLSYQESIVPFVRLEVKP